MVELVNERAVELLHCSQQLCRLSEKRIRIPATDAEPDISILHTHTVIKTLIPNESTSGQSGSPSPPGSAGPGPEQNLKQPRTSFLHSLHFQEHRKAKIGFIRRSRVFWFPKRIFHYFPGSLIEGQRPEGFKTGCTGTHRAPLLLQSSINSTDVPREGSTDDRATPLQLSCYHAIKREGLFRDLRSAYLTVLSSALKGLQIKNVSLSPSHTLTHTHTLGCRGHWFKPWLRTNGVGGWRCWCWWGSGGLTLITLLLMQRLLTGFPHVLRKATFSLPLSLWWIIIMISFQVVQLVLISEDPLQVHPVSWSQWAQWSQWDPEDQ